MSDHLDPPGIPPAATDTDSPRRRTTPKLSSWDRVKVLALLLGIFVILVWARLVAVPIEPLAAASAHVLRSAWWLDLLFVVEGLRQLHYFAADASPAWERLWYESVLKPWRQSSQGMSDWTRFRLGRALKVLGAVVLLAVVLGAALHTSPVVALFDIPALIAHYLGYVALVFFYIFLFLIQFIALFWFMGKGGVETYFPGDIKTRFSDVWGQDSVLERVKENIIFLKDPDSIEAKGGYVPGGILLWGPPGTGKTLMAEAVAGETENPFVFVEPAAFQNMFFGVGPLKVKSLFRKLRRLALRYGGVVVFFDEADSLGNRGRLATEGGFPTGAAASDTLGTPGCNGLSYVSAQSAHAVFLSHLSSSVGDGVPDGRRNRVVTGMGGLGGGGDMGTLQALLTEISGLKKPRGFFNRVVRRSLGMRPKAPPKYRILIMMASNLPEALDEALLRPGRIDRIYKVGYPSKAGRIRTYEGYFAKVSHQLTTDQIDRLATITPYATGATIKDLVNESLINAIRDGRDVVTWRDVVRAKQLKDLGPPEDVEYIERERHAVAVHEACHAVVAAKVRQHLTIDIATIEKGGTYLGMVASIPPEDQFTRWRSEYEADIMVSLASLAGERLFFDGDNSSGVSGDLDAATTVAALMEGYWGMGRTVSSHAVAQRAGIGLGRPRERGRGLPDGEGTPSALADRVEVKLEDLLRRTRDLLADNRAAVLAVAHALETHKTVTGEDVEAIIEGRVGPLIDGRMYHKRDFLDAAEAYHVKALEAHRAHGRVDLPLPYFLPDQPPAEPHRELVGSSQSEAHTWKDPERPESGPGSAAGDGGD